MRRLHYATAALILIIAAPAPPPADPEARSSAPPPPRPPEPEPPATCSQDHLLPIEVKRVLGPPPPPPRAVWEGPAGRRRGRMGGWK